MPCSPVERDARQHLRNAAPILIGKRRDGRPIYLVQGATSPPAPADPPAPQPQPPAPDPAPADPPKPEPGDPEGLGEAGKRALREEREAKKAAEQRAQAAEAELKKIREANQSEQEKALGKAADDARAETTAKFKEPLLRAAVQAAAAGKFVSANAAVALIVADLKSGDVVDDDGRVDEQKVTKAVEDLLAREPNLAATASPAKKPSFDGGRRTTDDKPSVATGRDLYAQRHAKKTKQTS